MDIKEKKLLFEYTKLYQPIWEITEFHGTGKHGIYRFWAYPSSTWSNSLEEKISVMRYDGYDWEKDGYASWEFIQKIVDNHRAGKVLNDLAAGITREVPKTIWR